MTTQMELRHTDDAWPELDFEVRSVGDGMEFRGYAAVFDSLSEDLGGFRERIAPGAFTRSLNSAANGGRDIRMFLNHNQDVVLGSTRAKTLRLSQDDRGLLVEATLPDHEMGRAVSVGVQRGDIRSMSFGFMVDKGGDVWSPDHKERTLKEVRLLEVSPVTGWPAYTATDASVRALLSAIDWEDEESGRAVIDRLSEEQRDILHRLLNRERAVPFISPAMAELRERFAARLEQAMARGVHVSGSEPQLGAQALEPGATT